MKYFYKLICITLLCLCLTACTGGTNSFTWFVDAIPTNLDPQIAITSEDIIACTNLYGTLVREDENGDLQLDLAASYTISADGLTYTFTLRDDIVYYTRSSINNNYTLTADDFVYAFVRIYSAETESPYAELYANIKNGTDILNGTAAAYTLGVKALDDSTVQFTLSSANDAFLETLALPAAAPCNQEFFESTKGTYGLTSSNTLSSGAFYLYNWTSTGLFLRRNAESGMVDSLRLVENSDTSGKDAETLILDENCTAITDTSASETTLNSITYSDTTWCLLYNQDSILSNQDLRGALSATATSVSLAEMGAFDPAVEGLIPAEIELEGLDYRSSYSSAMPTLATASEYFDAVLASLTMSDLKGISLLIPEGYNLDSYVESINSAWQKELSLYFSVETVDEATFYSRLASGDYTIALAPITMTQSDIISFMSTLSRTYGLNYNNSTYTTLLQLASTENNPTASSLLYQAECMLLNEFVVTPLFSQEKRLLVDTRVEHLVFNPFGPVLDLTYATKKS